MADPFARNRFLLLLAFWPFARRCLAYWSCSIKHWLFEIERLTTITPLSFDRSLSIKICRSAHNPDTSRALFPRDPLFDPLPARKSNQQLETSCLVSVSHLLLHPPFHPTHHTYPKTVAHHGGRRSGGESSIASPLLRPKSAVDEDEIDSHPPPSTHTFSLAMHETHGNPPPSPPPSSLWPALQPLPPSILPPPRLLTYITPLLMAPNRPRTPNAAHAPRLRTPTQFVKFYYQTFDSNRDGLTPLYVSAFVSLSLSAKISE